MNNKVKLILSALVGAVFSGLGLSANWLLKPGIIVLEVVGVPSSWGWGPIFVVLLGVSFFTYAGLTFVLLSLLRRAS